MEYLVFGRTEYAEPLALVTTAAAPSTPTVDDLDTGDDWLELTLVPADEIIWILRDGEQARRAWASASEPEGGDHRVRASASEPEGGDHRVRASASEPEGGDHRVRASASEPEGGDHRVRASASEPEGGDHRVALA